MVRPPIDQAYNLPVPDPLELLLFLLKHRETIKKFVDVSFLVYFAVAFLESPLNNDFIFVLKLPCLFKIKRRVGSFYISCY